MLSNHDFPRLASRLGEHAARGAALLLLTLPGTAFVYQGDELGMGDGPQGEPPVDRFGRDAYRNPMQWDGSPTGGFTTGRPWLPPTDPAARNVADQRRDPGSILSLYRRLIEMRRELRGELRLVDSTPELVAFTRGRHLIAVNAGERPAAAPPHGEVAARERWVVRHRDRAGRGSDRAPRWFEGLLSGAFPKRPLEEDVNGRGDRLASSRRIKGVLVIVLAFAREPGAGMWER